MTRADDMIGHLDGRGLIIRTGHPSRAATSLATRWDSSRQIPALTAIPQFATSLSSAR
jgi:hypothetical protein